MAIGDISPVAISALYAIAQTAHFYEIGTICTAGKIGLSAVFY